MNRRTSFVARPLVAVLMALMLIPAVASAQTKIKPGFNLFSTQQDVEVGQQSAAEAEQQLPIVQDSAVENYVNRIGQRLAQNAGGPQFQYRFRVVNDSDINAFALPGGFVYVNRGVLEQARNEGEVAGVMAHEIAHVALRHGTHQASKAYAAQAGLSILGGILGGKVGQGAGQIINAVGGFGMNVLFLKYSRDLESQADIRGSQILAASGYSPTDMVNFFHTLENVDKSRKTSFLSDHPAPPDRIARIQKEATMLNVTQSPTTNVAELNSIQGRLRGTAGGTTSMASTSRPAPTTTARSRGTGSGQVIQVEAPASALRSYTSPSGVYRIGYPSNWQVYQEGSTGVTLAPKGGIGTVNGKTEVVYGAIINHYDPFNNASRSYLRGGAANTSLTAATNDLLSEVQRDSPHLRLISGSEQQFTLSGGAAIAASLRGTNPNTGINERVTIVTRQLADDHLVYMLFVTPDKDASRYSSVLQAMVNSIQIDENRSH